MFSLAMFVKQVQDVPRSHPQNSCLYCSPDCSFHPQCLREFIKPAINGFVWNTRNLHLNWTDKIMGFISRGNASTIYRLLDKPWKEEFGWIYDLTFTPGAFVRVFKSLQAFTPILRRMHQIHLYIYRFTDPFTDSKIYTFTHSPHLALQRTIVNLDF